MATSQARTSYVYAIPALIGAPLPNPYKIYNGVNTSSIGASTLTDASATFTTNGVAIGDIVYNLTDFKSAEITSINSNTQLGLSNATIWASANAVYNIYRQSSLAGAIPQQGAILYNNGSTAFSGTGYTMDGVLFTFYIPGGSVMPIQVKQVVTWGGAGSTLLALW